MSSVLSVTTYSAGHVVYVGRYMIWNEKGSSAALFQLSKEMYYLMWRLQVHCETM